MRLFSPPVISASWHRSDSTVKRDKHRREQMKGGRGGRDEGCIKSKGWLIWGTVFLSGQPTTVSEFSQSPPLVEENLSRRKIIFRFNRSLYKKKKKKTPLTEKRRQDLYALSHHKSHLLSSLPLLAPLTWPFSNLKVYAWFQLAAGKTFHHLGDCHTHQPFNEIRLFTLLNYFCYSHPSLFLCVCSGWHE